MFWLQLLVVNKEDEEQLRYTTVMGALLICLFRLVMTPVDVNVARPLTQILSGGHLTGSVVCGLSEHALSIKGVVNCQNSRDKGSPEGNSARG